MKTILARMVEDMSSGRAALAKVLETVPPAQSQSCKLLSVTTAWAPVEQPGAVTGLVLIGELSSQIVSPAS